MNYSFIPAKFFWPGWKLDPKIIVIHWIAGSYKGCIETFSKGLREASAHFVISKTGDIMQMVELKNRSWHAGLSNTKLFGPNANLYSVGIELEGPPSMVMLKDWPQEQLNALLYVIEHIKKELPTIEYITDHSTISPGRKIDVKCSTGHSCDVFPWQWLVEKSGLMEI